jgi:membrane protein
VAAAKRAKDHKFTDQAAALTYYSVLAIFPAALVVVALLGVIGDPETMIDRVLNAAGQVVPDDVVQSLRGPVTDLANQPGAGLTLVVGVLLALWSASSYVAVAMRVLNTVDEVDEGRTFVHKTALRIGLTLLLVVVAVVVVILLASSGPVVRAVAQPLGQSESFMSVWRWLRWLLATVLFVGAVSTVYAVAPNSRKRFHLVSPGGLLALAIWLAASTGFAWYVASFASYNKTYGALAGAIVALVWLWLTNLALVLGAEWDAELARRRGASELSEVAPAR